MAPAYIRHGSRQQILLDIASDKASEASRGGGLQSRALASTPSNLVDLDRMTEPFHQYGTEWLDLDISLYEPVGIGGRQHRSWHRQLLHPCRQMRCLADHREVDDEIISDRGHHDLAGVDSHAHGDRQCMQSLNLDCILRDSVLHPQARVTGAHGMILVGDRRAEQSHDAVAHHPVDHAFVVMNGLQHALKNGIEDPLRLLRIAVRDQLH